MRELLEILDLHTYFHTGEGLVKANYGVNLSVKAGETMGIMGETGCGKTVLALSVLRLQQPGKIERGCILFEGRDITALRESEMEQLRGTQIAFVPQDPATGLNPAFTIGEQLLEMIRVRAGRRGLRDEMLRILGRDGNGFPEVIETLRAVGIQSPEEAVRRYPHQLSGGMRQRALIGMALLGRPKLLIADEPTTALDPATRVRIVELLKAIKGRTTIMLISHDPDVVRAICDRVAVMYAGRIVEVSSAGRVLKEPLHPYTRGLLSSVPRGRKERLPCIRGEGPDLIRFPTGCSFHPRCDEAKAVCREEEPPEVRLGDVRVRCHLYAST